MDVGNAISTMLNFGLGGVLLYLIFFKFQPEAREEREKINSAFLLALEKHDLAMTNAIERRDEIASKDRKEHYKDGAKTRLFIRAAIMVLTGKCPDTNLDCPFKAAELAEDQENA